VIQPGKVQNSLARLGIAMQAVEKIFSKRYHTRGT
jgi:hypothetical protein